MFELILHFNINFIAHGDRIGGSNIINFEDTFYTGIKVLPASIFNDVPAAGRFVYDCFVCHELRENTEIFATDF